MWVAKLEWDTGNDHEAVAARTTFGAYLARGYLA
ncbi:hypothetical protein LCGC14_2904690, partial [marine sediment metagenome]